MKILIAGGSGLIGQKLIQSLQAKKQKHQITVLSRKSGKILGCPMVSWEDKNLLKVISEQEVIVNLCGENIFDKRWTDTRKKELEESRIKSTRRLVNMINQNKGKQKIALIQGSAIGFYGFTNDQFLDESAGCGKDFVANLCRRWENEARKLKEHSRLVIIRTGVVLSPQGRTFRKMTLPFKLGIGGRLASGTQWFSWIHIDDIVKIFVEAIFNKQMKGVMNGTAPEPLTNQQAMRVIGRAMHRPSRITTPGCVLKFLLGERSILLTQGQRVIPKRSREFNISFKYPVLERALEDLLK